MGMTVFSGMLAATVIGVLIVPALYVLIERVSGRGRTISAVSAEEGDSTAEDSSG